MVAGSAYEASSRTVLKVAMASSFLPAVHWMCASSACGWSCFFDLLANALAVSMALSASCPAFYNGEPFAIRYRPSEVLDMPSGRKRPAFT